MELYIGTRDKDRNARIYNGLLARKETIEQTFGGSLLWEGLNDKPVARVASYYHGEAAVRDEQHTLLQEPLSWAVDTIIRLYAALKPHVQDILAELEP